MAHMEEDDAVSYRSSTVSLTHNPDDQLLSANHFLSVVTHENNHFINLTSLKNPTFPILSEILKVHPLNHVLTYNPSTSGTHVPELYVQQFWHSAHIHTSPRTGKFSIRGDVDHFTVVITVERLREIFRLPAANSRPFYPTFEEIPDEHTALAAIRKMGYIGDLERKSQFKRSNLHPIYYVFLTILQRCLTPKHTGYEYPNDHQLKIFVAAANHLHIDYALLFFQDLKATIESKDDKKTRAKFLPYPRFLPMIIQFAMDHNLDIPRRADHPSITSKVFNYLNPNNLKSMIAAHPMEPQPFPISLLNLCEQNEIVVSYRESVGVPPMVRLERGVQRENPKRGGEVGEGETHREGGDVYDPGTVQTLVDSLAYVTNDPESEYASATDAEISEAQTVETEQIEIGTPDSNLEAHTDTTPDFMQIRTQVQSPQRVDNPAYHSLDLNIDTHAVVTAGQGGITLVLDPAQRRTDLIAQGLVEPQSEPNSFHTASITLSDSGVAQNIYKGYGFTEEVESEREVLRKEHASAEGPPAIQSREATTSTRPDFVGSGIETDTVIPAMHISAPPSHLGISQQMPTLLHRAVAHTLSTSHSETVGIETRGTPPSSSNIPLSHIDMPQISAFLSRHKDNIGQLALLCKHAPGTSVGDTTEGVIRGSKGSPTGVNTTPTPTVGGSVLVAGTSTGNLSDPGFVTRAEVPDSIQQAVKPLHEKLDSLQATLNTMQPKVDDGAGLSIDTLKSFLLSRLLEKAPHREQDNDLITTLQLEQTYKGSNLNEFKEEIRTMITDLTNAFWSKMDVVDDRLKAVENACKTQAAGSKRKHDDQDPDQDRPEGEKRMRFLTFALRR